MYLSLNWLKDFVKLPKNVSPDDLAKLLTLHTVEVEGVERQADKYDNVVIGKILKIGKHPNADRLQVAQVSVGKEELQIVCGAPNIAVGQIVPVALVGAVLPNGLEIKEAEVRGVKSCGMMCAADELGIGDDHSGIYLLDSKAKVGQPLAGYLKLDDIVFEVDNKSITNRPDLWSHMGMARDIAAILDAKFSPYSAPAGMLSSDSTVNLPIKVEDTKLCPRYMAIAMDNIRVEPSPKWMADRLIAAGVRPISNIVDITNYVMLELGQPMHAFDRSTTNEVIVRRAKKDEQLETLDGIKRQLTADDLVIANKDMAVGIAGVMGGANSGIDTNTTSIIFESANFDPSAVRKTSRRLGLRTESSVRFEKSLDPNLCELALQRAVQLVKQLVPGATISSSLTDIKNFSLFLGPIMFDMKAAVSKMGAGVPEKMIGDILKRLGFTYEKKGHILEVAIPSWRATKDVSIMEDLVEEVIRIYGYDNLLPTMPSVVIKSALMDSELLLERKVKLLLAGGAALTEVYNYSFVGEDLLKKMNIDYSNYVHLANPISNNHTMLRQTLAPNLLLNVKTNQARYAEFGMFEVGSIYLSSAGDIIKDDRTGEKLPYQEKRLIIVMAGADARDLYDRLKGIVEYLAASLELEVGYQKTSAVAPWAEEAFATDISVSNSQIGSIMKLDSRSAKQLGIKKETVLAEISLKSLLRAYETRPIKAFREFERFPSLVRDLAFVVDAKIVYNDIKRTIAGFNELINRVELFDVYEGEHIGAGKRSLAFRVTYQADRTLIATEVDAIQTDLIKHLEEKFEAKVRNF